MMIPKTKKLFISYRSSDHREVDYIAEQLRSLKHDDGTTKYKTWQDKHDLKGGKSWWDGIVDAIIDCDMFVFHITPEYLGSTVCIAELDYAIERGRPIIPVVLDSAYYINPRTKKPDIDFWKDVPEWLGKYQFIFYDEEDFLSRFEGAVAEYELAWPQDIPIRRPLSPAADSLHGNNYEVYKAAVDHALKASFNEAKLLFRELVRRNDSDFAHICRQWLVLLDRYQDLLNAKQHQAPRSVFQRNWNKYVSQFPLNFVDDLYSNSNESVVVFDPKEIGQWYSRHRDKTKSQSIKSKQEIETEQTKAKNNTTTIEYHSKPLTTKTENNITEPVKPSQSLKVAKRQKMLSSVTFLPQPFAWVSIQSGSFTRKETYTEKEPGGYLGFGKKEVTKTKLFTVDVTQFDIAKYPVTNAQFREFIKADGYKNKSWWTKQGWQFCQRKNWTEPLYWNDDKWNGDTQPVVGVSWFEAVAFCLWITDSTGENIMLLTKDQWQYAAQGDDGRIYPWGNDWDCEKCNNSVKPCRSYVTTSVNEYEEVGASSFGVVDMVGNAWEWCLTGRDKNNTVDSIDDVRNLQGGCWSNHLESYYVVDDSYPYLIDPNSRFYEFGFRVSRT